MAGYFITFEGGEGAGKSTQIDRLRRRFEQLGQPVLVTREPGGSPYAEELRAFILEGRAKHLGPFAEAVLFAAARIDHIDKTVEPSLQRGVHVLCDRFADSTRAYQGASGNLDNLLIGGLERVTLRGVKPDLTLILDLPAEVGLSRAGSRRLSKGEGVDRFENEAHAFHQTLREAYLAIAGVDPERCAVIDANRSPDEVEATIWAAVRQRLPALAAGAKRPVDVA
ncbi:dTMP kinase [Microvirga terricola]|uniref:Thymidylate kinase n=1 Tax=Microvirga terricola TaxID=2719797 RepID=A0ABX0VCV4_9HYPH|nr:dTMP kinase [Microvirga terricola]NIX77497.1 dTMP kinase [Microvirga terricola]